MFAPLILAILAQRAWGAPELLVSLKDPRITESSGVAASPTRDGVYYTHNDSGDSARFFRFTRTGVDAVFSLVGVKALDWEDMASARIGGKNWIYLGDIGDNQEKRPQITIYRIEEPTGSGRTLTKFDTYSLSYPDGPHNCETLIVDPGSGDIYLVTKGDKESIVYRLEAPRKPPYRLQKLGSLSPNTGLGKYGRLVTAGATDPWGKHVVIRTYTGALEYTVKGAFREWWKQSPVPVNMPLDPQGEAICYSRDGRALVTTSEGSPCPVHLVPIKK